MIVKQFTFPHTKKDILSSKAVSYLMLIYYFCISHVNCIFSSAKEKKIEIKKTAVFGERDGSRIFTWAEVCMNRLSFLVTSLLRHLFLLQQNNPLNFISVTLNANDAVL